MLPPPMSGPPEGIIIAGKVSYLPKVFAIIGEPMEETRRVIRATRRAVPLLTDIISSTSYLYAEVLPAEELAWPPNAQERIRAEITSADYLIGFEHNLPFGFVGIEKIEACCRLIGPYLYREYLGKGYGEFLLDFGIKLASATGLNPIFLLVHRQATWATAFFGRHGFEQISDDPEFIRRWRDGILADYPLPGNQVLMARLLDRRQAPDG
jgi:GNAT superfamily N-acetyltransferase